MPLILIHKSKIKKGQLPMKEIQNLSEETLRELLENTEIPTPHVYQTLKSTNINAKEAAENGAAQWSCIAANEQSAGRGRLGRSFYSPGGSGLYFSVILRPKIATEDAVMLTTAAAVAVCRTAEEEFGVFPKIKWVNDVFHNSKKVCGILTEAAFGEDVRMKYAVVGVGVNLLPPKGGFPDNISDVAGSLINDNALPSAKSIFLASFLRCYRGLYEDIENCNSKKIADEYRRRCFVIGKEINILTAGEITGTGTAEDVDDKCRLIVRSDSGAVRVLDAGEISIRIKQ